MCTSSTFSGANASEDKLNSSPKRKNQDFDDNSDSSNSMLIQEISSDTSAESNMIHFFDSNNVEILEKELKSHFEITERNISVFEDYIVSGQVLKEDGLKFQIRDEILLKNEINNLMTNYKELCITSKMTEMQLASLPPEDINPVSDDEIKAVQETVNLCKERAKESKNSLKKELKAINKGIELYKHNLDMEIIEDENDCYTIVLNPDNNSIHICVRKLNDERLELLNVKPSLLEKQFATLKERFDTTQCFPLLLSTVRAIKCSKNN